MNDAPYLGEISIVSFNFAPKGWAMCNGQLLPINQNQALFSILGTTYGGNGQTNFALPDFRGRIPAHWGGDGIILGQRLGTTANTVQLAQLPQHTHPVNGFVKLPVASSGISSAPADAYPASDNTNRFRSEKDERMALMPAQQLTAAPVMSSWVGGAAVTAGDPPSAWKARPYPNMQPYLVLNFIIALIGIFPSRN
ncbi:Microcystin-dependent protein [Chitinophaga jiangningensis]|uniref:Microcystin-dependent protein n=1 Tax=Chitinophaga jiangningensis TaxID=1419482 RepID=A0A1M7J2P0_9BACT|nr:tail fiber protein [Chitinophaga jiangningensis]SHM47354.1 Microcystin-dependent protein [Chitinophaga jiangningensis]